MEDSSIQKRVKKSEQEISVITIDSQDNETQDDISQKIKGK